MAPIQGTSPQAYFSAPRSLRSPIPRLNHQATPYTQQKQPSIHPNQTNSSGTLQCGIDPTYPQGTTPSTHTGRTSISGAPKIVAHFLHRPMVHRTYSKPVSTPTETIHSPAALARRRRSAIGFLSPHISITYYCLLVQRDVLINRSIFNRNFPITLKMHVLIFN